MIILCPVLILFILVFLLMLHVFQIGLVTTRTRSASIITAATTTGFSSWPRPSLLLQLREIAVTIEMVGAGHRDDYPAEEPFNLELPPVPIDVGFSKPPRP